MKHLKHLGWLPALTAAALACWAIGWERVGAQTRGAKVEIKTLSTDARRVTGGDVLVEISLPNGAASRAVKITANGRDVSHAFQPGAQPGTFMGLITGLVNGKNTLAVSTKPTGAPDSSLEITNYPITGPVFSGPQIRPFFCQTDVFKLPDGTTLGTPLDENCSAKTVVQYVYRTTGDTPTFKPLSQSGGVPSDVARTTTIDGKTVNFIVRVETGTMDRGIYQNTILLIQQATDRPHP